MILLSDTELCDDSSVALDVLLCQVIEHLSSLTDHLQQTAAAVVILLVDLQVLCELSDALCEDGDLNLRRTCVVVVQLIAFDDLCFLFFPIRIFSIT